LNDRPGSDTLLSVVVAASDTPGAVARTLSRLDPSSLPGPVEFLVAAARERAPVEKFTGLDVNWVVAGPGATVPRLRRLGLDHARGAVVVFTEDSCVLLPGWVTAWREAFTSSAILAASGRVEPAMGSRLIDWAVLFFEYAPFLVSHADNSSPPPRLAGNNFAVGPALISHLDPEVIEESDIPPLVARRGGTVAWADQAVVLHARRYRLLEALDDRCHLGWTFGRRRAARFNRAGRLAGLFAGPAIWLAQLSRLGLTVLRTGRHRARFAASLPLLLALVTAWTAGEWLGWASGFHGSGRSAQRTLR
jgi:hypothetical protein